MNVILTYDLSGSNSPVKKTMIENGYSIIILSDGKIIHLPETTLFHKEKTPDQAIADIQLAAVNLQQKTGQIVKLQFYNLLY